jgi:hypothetical protein
VRLTSADGTLVQPVPGGPWVVSAQGYEVLAEATGTCVMLPEQVLVDGEMKRNPFVMRDPQNGRILSIYARAVALRHSSKGIPQVSDWVTLFDAPSYRMIDLLAKAKKSPTAFRFLPSGLEPEQEDGKTWARYDFDAATALWVNTSNEEALQWYSTIINREKKSIDYAQTFARRNAVKHLLGVQKAPGPAWDLTVLCWRPVNGSFIKWDYTRYADTRQRVERIIRGEDSFVKKAELEYHAGSECVGDDKQAAEALDHELNQDDEQAQAIGEISDDDKQAIDIPAEDVKVVDENPQPEPPQPPKTAKKYSPEEQYALDLYRQARKNFPAEYRQALRQLDLAEGFEVTPLIAGKIYDAVNSILSGSDT